MIPVSSRLIQAVQTSLTIKVFTICFMSVHVPLLIFIVYLVRTFADRPEPILLLLLAATVVGAAICLLSLWWTIRPLRQLAQAIKAYQADGTPLRMSTTQPDEIGLLASTVTGMVAETENLMARLRHQAMTDTLTGLANRRRLNEHAAEELRLAMHRREPLSMIMFDLDRFKGINDSHGHTVGDCVLMAAGEAVKTCIRSGDLAARIGGEEFCVVLPATGGEEAAAVAECIRKALASMIVAPLKRGGITASFGVCQARVGEGLQTLLQRSDKALYEAKRAGRNRVQWAGLPGASHRARCRHRFIGPPRHPTRSLSSSSTTTLA
jgi:diguanylate cyclase (GGDEF)-like protein